MVYKLIITERAAELLDNILYYFVYRLKNEQAAKHLLSGIENVYDRLEKNPHQFPISRDTYLASKGYHEAIIPQMEYVIVFDIKNGIVHVVGIFHQLENYQRKL